MSFTIQDFAVKNSPLTIAVGADHGGFEAKKALIAKLNESSIAFEWSRGRTGNR